MTYIFQEALKLSPDHVIALDNLGSCKRQEALARCAEDL